MGSNHNSRATDGEIVASRGFWPGLCSSVKHSSKFASFTLLSKADYPNELNIMLPFSLVSNNTADDELQVMPAYWWMYNMYAIARNTSKYQKRDKRKRRIQHIEFETFAPDTMEEAIEARKLLELWTGKALLLSEQRDPGTLSCDELRKAGRDLLNNNPEAAKRLEVFGENMEHGKRRVRILKHYEAYHAYGDMLLYYGAKNLALYLDSHPEENLESLCEKLRSKEQREWINLGGQLVNSDEVEALRHDINSGLLNTWEDIHHRYDELWERYPVEKLRHAFSSLRFLYLDRADTLTPAVWKEILEKACQVQQFICDQVYLSRKKDYDNPFRNATFRNEEEKIAVIGELDEVNFVKQIREETEKNIQLFKKYM